MRILVAIFFFVIHSAPAYTPPLTGWHGCRSKVYETSVLECTELLERAKIKSIAVHALYYRGEAYRREGENEKAIADFQDAISINPRFANAYQRLAIVQMRIGEFANATANAKKAYSLEETRTTHSMLLALGVMPGRLKDHENARASSPR